MPSLVEISAFGIFFPFFSFSLGGFVAPSLDLGFYDFLLFDNFKFLDLGFPFAGFESPTASA